MKLYFLGIAVLYWISTAGRLFLWEKNSYRWEQIMAAFEKFCLLTFTAGIVWYIHKLKIVDGSLELSQYESPLSWLLFAWCLNAANAVSEIAYGNTLSALFANFWTAMALSVLPKLRSESFQALFTNDIQWLNFHRLCFLLGYAFCVLAFPLALLYLWKSFRFAHVKPDGIAQAERYLWKIDRMAYRMILWALPLLTLGFILEALSMMEKGQLPDPLQLWTERKEAFLGLATWFICGIYLHSRLFFGWKNRRCAFMYLAGLIIVIIGHFSTHFLQYRS